MLLARVFRAAVVAALLSTAAGCRRPPTLQAAPSAELRFASDYIQFLRDSGAAAVLPRTHPRTRALPNMEANLTAMRDALTKSRAELTLARWTIKQVTGRPRATEVMYTAHAPGAPSEIGVWIENYEGRLVVETIFVGPPVGGAPPR